MFNNDGCRSRRGQVNFIRHSRPRLLLVLAAVASPTFSAGTPLEAYSPVECSIWSLEDALPEDLARSHSARSSPPGLRQALSAGIRDARARGDEPELFTGQAFPKRKGPLPRTAQTQAIGCLRIQIPSGSGKDRHLQCHVEVSGRLETYVFRALPPQMRNEPKSYGCEGECSAYPVRVVHEMPWEDGAASRRQRRASLEYAKRCLHAHP